MVSISIVMFNMIFRLWFPKLSRDCIVLFHDTNEHGLGYGVARFFGELAASYRSFEFLHGHGLGVLALGKELPIQLVRLFEADKETIENIRIAYTRLGEGVSCHLNRRYDEEAVANLKVDRARLENALTVAEAEKKRGIVQNSDAQHEIVDLRTQRSRLQCSVSALATDLDETGIANKQLAIEAQ